MLAIEMTRILLHFLASLFKGIEFVTINSSISDLFNLSIAGPDRTGWVIYAFTAFAPLSFNAFAALQSVPAVSIMSSGTIQTFPSTSPMMFITSDSFATALLLSIIAIIDKRRAVANESEVMNIIGEVEGKVCIVPDDIIDTAGTLCNAAKALKDKGAKAVKAYITHPVLSGPAIERLNKSDIDELIVTNSIPLNKDAKKCSKIRVISIANIIAECITRLSNEESLSEMFL